MVARHRFRCLLYRLAGIVHPGTYLFGTGMVEFVEDVERSLPDVAGRLDVANRMIGVAERGEAPGQEEGAARRLSQAHDPLVARDGIVVPAEMPVGVAQGVQCGRFDVRAVERAGEIQRLSTVGDGLVVVAEIRGVPARTVPLGQSTSLAEIRLPPGWLAGALSITVF